MIEVMKSVMMEALTDTNPKEEFISAINKSTSSYIDEMRSIPGISERANGGIMTLEEYLVWSLSNPLPEQFLTLIYQVCQIVFGLKPLDPAEEYDVVISWLTREEKRGYHQGQIWYVVSMEWWNAWGMYSNPNPPQVMSNSDSGLSSMYVPVSVYRLRLLLKS